MEENSFGTGGGFYSTTLLYISIPWLCLAFAVTPQHTLIVLSIIFLREMYPYIY